MGENREYSKNRKTALPEQSCFLTEILVLIFVFIDRSEIFDLFCVIDHFDNFESLIEGDGIRNAVYEIIVKSIPGKSDLFVRRSNVR